MTIDEQVPIWNAINEYANSCGANQDIISDRRMDAVSVVNGAIEKLFRQRLNLMIEGAEASAIERESLRARLSLSDAVVAAARVFANYACDEDEKCDCNNCRVRAALRALDAGKEE